MSDLLEFLKARLDEDEAVARAALTGPYRIEDPHDYVHCLVSAESDYTDEQYTHALTWSPFRVLAEVAAKRRIVDLAQTWIGAGYPTMDNLLRYLALPYADYPDYRQEWRP